MTHIFNWPKRRGPYLEYKLAFSTDSILQDSAHPPQNFIISFNKAGGAHN